MSLPIVYTESSLRDALADVFGQLAPDKVLLVTGKDSFELSGAKQICKEVFRTIASKQFCDFSTNPKLEDLVKGIDIARNFSPDVIVAIGGGSVLDIAKSISLLANVDQDIRSTVIGSSTLDSVSIIPTVAVPTTTGTGAEATQFSVVYVDGIKYSLSHTCMRPQYVILDAVLTQSLSSYITACAAFDALGQAIESMWSIQSNPESCEYAREAFSLLIPALTKAVKGDLQARHDLLLGAYKSGKAINISRTTASHALSYPLTAHHGLPHGHAVGLTLGKVLLFNSGVTKDDLNDPRGLEHVNSILREIYNFLGASSAIEAEKKLYTLMQDMGLSTNLSELGIKSQDELFVIAKEVSQERAKNNPRFFDETSASSILSSLYKI